MGIKEITERIGKKMMKKKQEFNSFIKDESTSTTLIGWRKRK